VATKPVANAKKIRLESDTTPKFPYTTKPASLRRALKEIPQKPKPKKIDQKLLQTWGYSDNNDTTIVRVLKTIGLLTDAGEPTDLYAKFMDLADGAKYLAPEIKRVYEPLFQASLAPYNESQEKLRNMFNINSGGGDRAIDQQIQTFKALCENANFEEAAAAPAPLLTAQNPEIPIHRANGSPTVAYGVGEPIVNINLHIHLPENKSRREYEDIIEDIGRYIFGRQSDRAK